MKTALFLSEYDLSTVHYLCSYYKDNANLDIQDVEYINELQSRVDKLMEMVIDTLSTCKDLSDPAFSMYYVMQDAVNKEVIYPMESN